MFARACRRVGRAGHREHGRGPGRGRRVEPGPAVARPVAAGHLGRPGRHRRDVTGRGRVQVPDHRQGPAALLLGVERRRRRGADQGAAGRAGRHRPRPADRIGSEARPPRHQPLGLHPRRNPRRRDLRRRPHEEERRGHAGPGDLQRRTRGEGRRRLQDDPGHRDAGRVGRQGDHGDGAARLLVPRTRPARGGARGRDLASENPHAASAARGAARPPRFDRRADPRGGGLRPADGPAAGQEELHLRLLLEAVPK